MGGRWGRKDRGCFWRIDNDLGTKRTRGWFSTMHTDHLLSLSLCFVWR